MSTLVEMTSRLLGVILARGGSKGIPGKNIIQFAGKPLLAWTITAGQQSKVLDRLVLSTDDPAIASVGHDFGAEVPFLRPPELAGDRATSMDALLHALEWLQEKERYVPDYVLLLQPTSPLRTAGDIVQAWKIMLRVGDASVVSVCEAHQHPLWIKKITSDGRLINFIPNGVAPAARQELPKAYIVNGAIYLSPHQRLLQRRTFHSDPTYAYVMSAERSIDIDTKLDLATAELLFKENISS